MLDCRLALLLVALTGACSSPVAKTGDEPTKDRPYQRFAELRCTSTCASAAVASSDALYIATPGVGDGMIYRVPKDGGVPTVVASGLETPNALLRLDRALAWTEPARIAVLDDDTGKVTTLAKTNEARGLALSGNQELVFAEWGAGTVSLMDQGGRNRRAFATEQDRPSAVAAYGSDVYWTCVGQDPARHGVFRATSTGHDITRLTTQVGGATSHLAVDFSGIYWDRQGIVRLDRSGGGPVEWVVQATPSDMGSLVLRQGLVFYVDTLVEHRTIASATMNRQPLIYSDVTANQTMSPSVIAVDETNLYWVDRYGGVYRQKRDFVHER